MDKTLTSLPRWVAVSWPWLSIFSTIVIMVLPPLTYLNYRETRATRMFFVHLADQQRARNQQRQDSARVELQRRVDSLQTELRKQ